MALPLTYNVRNLRVRWQVTLLAIVGIALVVAVFVVLLAMASGFQFALRATGRPDNAIVVQRGSASELTSWVPLEHRNRLQVDARVARGADGQPLASPELYVISNLPKRDSGEPTNVTVRGVTARAFEVRAGIKLLSGRMFQPGLNEVIVGERITARVRGLALGDKMRLQRTDWVVVGIFSSQGGAFESEVWGDLETMAGTVLRTGGSNSLVLRITDPTTIPAFDKQVRADPAMQLQVVPERQYYSDQAGPVAGSLTALAMFVSLIMGVGAVFGAMNTMYAIVAARTREVGTLRALGFGRGSILFSFVVESVFLALVGGLLGCLLALPMNGFTTGTAQATFSEVAFAFRVTPFIMALGLMFAVLMGFVGGLLPAWRASRLPITSALRSA
jgi:ABC-type lipoprotein release transport system permease subunit